MVVEPPLHHGSKPAADLAHHPVHTFRQLQFDGLQSGPHTLGDGFAFDDERPVLARSAVVRKAQEVERLRPPLAPFLASFRRITAEFDETGFVRMKLEAELLESFPQFAEKAFGVTAVLESHDEIVGVADHDYRPARVTAPPLVCPQIEDVVQEHVRKER
jgi:hypothetical protein